MGRMKPDEGHALTDKELAKLEKRISKVYGEAAKELQKTIDSYFESFSKRDEEMKSLIGTVQNGKEWTEADYKQWRLAQIGRGKRFEALQDKVAERMTKANQTAVSYVNDATPGIYSLNRNYAAYTIEQVTGDVGFNLWDEQTVRRLIVEEPDLMPYYPPKRAVNRSIDLAYGKRQISATVTSGILQGKSIKGLADDLQTRIPTMNRDSAIRTARTAVTGAQNGGRYDSYRAAKKMGIKIQAEWLATMDNRTRHSHAMLDGQKRDIDVPFEVDGEKILYPGYPLAVGSLIYNCRCTLVADVGYRNAVRRAIDPETGESVLIPNMSYQEWEAWKKSENATAWETYMKKGKNLSSDEKQYEEYRKILGNKMPSRFADFQDMKYNDAEKWSMLKLDRRRRVTLANNPDLALPGERKTIPQEKFTSYLFNQGNPSGWAKGQAFTSRLGYSAENWSALRREITSGAKKYPATLKSHTEYGDLYEQKMILYGTTGRPANVVVGWIHKPDGSTSMTTAYIKEV